MYSPHLANTTNHPFGIAVKSADGIYITDKNNHRYIDLISGIAVSNLGHQHPHIIKSLKTQLEKHLHVMVFGEYSQDIQNKLAESLTSLLPSSLDCS